MSEQAITRHLSAAQEARAAYEALKRPFYVDCAEFYGEMLARPWMVDLVNPQPDEAYRYARMAGHFGNLALKGQ